MVTGIAKYRRVDCSERLIEINVSRLATWCYVERNEGLSIYVGVKSVFLLSVKIRMWVSVSVVNGYLFSELVSHTARHTHYS